MFGAIALAIIFAVYTASFSAKASEPKIITNWKFYKIKGSDARTLKVQMKRKGPRGFWAYARWWVDWTSDCKVTVKLNYTFPEWTNQSSASTSLRSDWARMTNALKKHEENHGKHGIKAAREILASKCKNPRKTIGKWAKQDKVYDKRTKHGRLEGVKL